MPPYADSEPGYLDVDSNYNVRFVSGAIGSLDLEENYRQEALYWKITSAGQRVPLYARGPMSEGESGAGAWRRTLVPGEFFPDETNTGVYDSSVLEDVSGNITYTASGEYIENKRFLGRISVNGKDIHFRNCLFLGNPGTPSSSGDPVVARHANTEDITFEDCTIATRALGERANGPMVTSTTFLRCNIYGGIDGVGVVNAPAGSSRPGRADVQIIGTWIHDTKFYSPCSYQPDNVTHNDVIQWHGGRGLTIRGCRLEGAIDPNEGDYDGPSPGGREAAYWTTGRARVSPRSGKRRPSAILMGSPGNGTHGELVVEQNWMDHGTVGLNVTGDQDFLTPDGSRVVNNRLGLDWDLTQAAGGFTVQNSYALLFKSFHHIEISGNTVWNHDDPWDTSVPNNTRRNG